MDIYNISKPFRVLKFVDKFNTDYVFVSLMYIYFLHIFCLRFFAEFRFSNKMWSIFFFSVFTAQKKE